MATLPISYFLVFLFLIESFTLLLWRLVSREKVLYIIERAQYVHESNQGLQMRIWLLRNQPTKSRESQEWDSDDVFVVRASSHPDQ